VALAAHDRAGNGAFWAWSFWVNEPPVLVLLEVYPTTLVADGVSTATITVTATSFSGYPVADGTQVVFSTTLGTLDGGAVYTTTTQGGVATAVLTAPERAGTAVIRVRVGAAEGAIEVESVVEMAPPQQRIYLPIMLKAY